MHNNQKKVSNESGEYGFHNQSANFLPVVLFKRPRAV